MLENKIKEFKSLSYDKKFNICMNIITNLKDRGNQQALSIFGALQDKNNISENLLESIYTDFELSIEKIKQKNVEDDLHKFDNTYKYLDKLRYEEEKERLQENPEDILKKI